MSISALSSIRARLEGYLPLVTSSEAIGLAALGVVVTEVVKKSTIGAFLAAGYFAGSIYWRYSEHVNAANVEERSARLISGMRQSFDDGSFPLKRALFENRCRSIAGVLQTCRRPVAESNLEIARNMLFFAKSDRSPLSLSLPDFSRGSSPFFPDSLQGGPSPLVKSRTARDLAKRQAARTLSHEARNSIGGTINSLDLLRTSLRAGQLAAEQLDSLATAQRCAELALEYCNGYLDYAKLTHDPKLVSESFSFQELAGMVSAQVAPKAQRKNVAYKFEMAVDLPPDMIGDQKKLCQILVNFVGNAVKFTPEGGTVTVKARQVTLASDPYVRFEVTDTGRGISAENQLKLFQPFSQVGEALEGADKGTGLGLVICKQLIELMNGHISNKGEKSKYVGVASEEGKGSTFWFMVPLKREAVPTFSNALPTQSTPTSPKTNLVRAGASLLLRPRAAHDPDHKGGAAGMGLSSRASPLQDHPDSKSDPNPFPSAVALAAAAVFPVPAAVSSMGKEKRVLVLDDLDTNLKIMRRMLEKDGAQVDTAATGAEAVAAAEAHDYHLIFLDYNLGSADPFNGAMVAARIRALKPHQRMIGLTAGDATTIEACKAAGMEDVVTKPIKPSMVKKLLA